MRPQPWKAYYLQHKSRWLSTFKFCDLRSCAVVTVGLEPILFPFVFNSPRPSGHP
ncbi:hypothetical protein CCACVL1_26519 [Corchorus capsularis]|uniref:Uncharacterized protein n=1 Tax=Corchorus capsularis TaxID=210143 RepID=A0A1R3GEH8_COCAP|nr:hypothetical protein CCACVL1_26519 [Corchorus capsularis]